MRSIHLVTPELPDILVRPTADWMRQAVHLDKLRRSKPAAARDVLRDWRIRSS